MIFLEIFKHFKILRKKSWFFSKIPKKKSRKFPTFFEKFAPNLFSEIFSKKNLEMFFENTFSFFLVKILKIFFSKYFFQNDFSPRWKNIFDPDFFLGLPIDQYFNARTFLERGKKYFFAVLKKVAKPGNSLDIRIPTLCGAS